MSAMRGPAKEIVKSGLCAAHSSMKIGRVDAAAGRATHRGGDQSLEEAEPDRLLEHRPGQQRAGQGVGLVAHRGGESAQVLLGEARERRP